MKPLFIVFIFAFKSIVLFGGNDIETLNKELEQASLEERPGKKAQLAEYYLHKDSEQARHYASLAEQLALKLQQDYELGLSRKIQGNVNFIAGEWHDAIKHYQSALPAAHNSNDNELLGDLYYNLGRSYTNLKDHSSALDNLEKSLIYREKLSNRESETTTLNSIGLLYWEQQRYDKAVYFFQTATKLLTADFNPRLSAAIYNNLGNALLKSGETAEAGEAYVSSLRIRESFGTERELATANLNLGNLYYTATNYGEAISYYLQAQDLYSKIGDFVNEGLVLANIGSTYNDLNTTDLALEFHQAALLVFIDQNMQVSIGKTYNNMGNTFLKKSDYQNALEYYNKALQVKHSLEDSEGLAITYNNLSEVFFILGDMERAIESVEKSSELATAINDQKLLLNNYRQYAKIYEAMQEWQKTIEAYKRYFELDLMVYAIEKKDAIAEMMARFDAEKKEEQISELRLIQKLQTERMEQEVRAKLRILLLSISAFVTALIFGFLFRAKHQEVKKRKAVQKELETLNQELENRIRKALVDYDHNQKIVIQKSKLESLGNLAAGMAHEINQPLSAISMIIDNIQQKSQMGILKQEYLNKKCVQTHEDIQRIRKIIEHVRLFSRDQKDMVMEQFDINEVILNAVSLSRHSVVKAGINLKVKTSKDPLLILGNSYKMEQVLLNLISNAQDAIEEKSENSGAASSEKVIRLRSLIAQGKVVIEVSDSGIGIDPENIENIYDPFFTTKSPTKGTGLGLSISYGIVHEMDGKISITSELDKGTTVLLTFPFYKESK